MIPRFYSPMLCQYLHYCIGLMLQWMVWVGLRLKFSDGLARLGLASMMDWGSNEQLMASTQHRGSYLIVVMTLVLKLTYKVDKGWVTVWLYCFILCNVTNHHYKSYVSVLIVSCSPRHIRCRSTCACDPPSMSVTNRYISSPSIHHVHVSKHCAHKMDHTTKKWPYLLKNIHYLIYDVTWLHENIIKWPRW